MIQFATKQIVKSNDCSLTTHCIKITYRRAFLIWSKFIITHRYLYQKCRLNNGIKYMGYTIRFVNLCATATMATFQHPFYSIIYHSLNYILINKLNNTKRYEKFNWDGGGGGKASGENIWLGFQAIHIRTNCIVIETLKVFSEMAKLSFD